MNTKFDLYPFLLSRNKKQDYRVIVAPDFLSDNGLSALVQATRSEPETEPGTVLHCPVNFADAPENNFTLIFRVDIATEKDIGKKSGEILTDNAGRYIKFIAGFVCEGLIPEKDVRITSQDFQEFLREYLTIYYSYFWQSQINQVFRSTHKFNHIFYQPTSSNLLSVRSITTYYVNVLKPPPSLRKPSETNTEVSNKTFREFRLSLIIGMFIGVIYLVYLRFFFQIR